MGRKITSILILISSIIMVVSGIAVYLSPPSHLAAFSGWKIFYLKKNMWMALHINSALLFTIAFIFHTWFNIKPLIKYIFPKKIKASKNFIPLAVSLSIGIYVVGGTFYRLPPMEQVLKLGRSFKIKGIFSYGPVPPPYGKASSIPLKKISFFWGSMPDEIIRTLKNAGIKKISPDLSLKEIAQENNVTIGFILDSINKEALKNKKLSKL